MRTCKRCVIEKDAVDFKAHRAVCRACEAAMCRERRRADPTLAVARRDRELYQRYNITLSDYEGMLSYQRGMCGICGSTCPGSGVGAFCVDHDHTTMRVRGLLCLRCNTGLGMLGDDLAGIRRAVAYLEAGARDQRERSA